ncbi:hypothetical protein CEUSTIGMA_g7129.t1 [Chlamydomonas eustigma]|uniref:Cilia- and flagella-associated protein 251 n=1 Tax=Chlamydomonas eustigma TaxID=1157962 RepID=A0A250X9E1_9CHLO|nr:hypothetical protein CEUSTIGMA_g7129.t1 [Chlamydomonas eustigma]|eukprot:GAX79688.1 hypothetical protein CEUSTIGMA_g7129.t1 [Chlamydomonas eustigma]
MSEASQALALNWMYGTAIDVRGNVVNLSDGFSERVAFVAAHTAVIYDKRLQKQTFMQGHCNSISCILVTDDRGTIITADAGKESLLVLWNSKTGLPIQSINTPHKYGTIAMDISPDDEWLATVGAVDPETGEQEIALWSIPDTRVDSHVRPCVITSIPAGDMQLAVKFNMNDFKEIMTNGKRRVYFWSHQYPNSHRFKYYSPPLRSKDFKQVIGNFTMSVFIPGSPQALTATTDGDLVLWDEQGITAQMGTRATDRRASKLMRIHHSAINVLMTIGDYIVSGGEDGYIRFFDPLLRIVAWFEDLGIGPISGIAFSAAPPSKLSNTELADTINRFIAPDFVVTSTESRMIAVQTACFEEFEVTKRKGNVVLDAMLTSIVDVTTHPTRAEFAVLCSTGVLQRWDMVTHTCVATRTFSKMVSTKLSYSRDGTFLVTGFQGGFVHFLDTESLADVHSGRNTAADITKITCSTSGDQVAMADSVHHVLLYTHLPHKHGKRWEYVGRAQMHHQEVVGLLFGESPSGQTRLFSLGADSRMAEYDLENSQPATGLKLLDHIDTPTSILPTALSFAPPLQYYRHHSAETLLLTCDAQFKMRMYNADTRAAVTTFLGPTFGGPVTNLIMFKSASSDGAYLAYCTKERVVGLIAWPMDGDPAKTMGLIAHPGAIQSMAVSYDGRKLLTTGTDGTLAVWDVLPGVLGKMAEEAASGTGRWEKVISSPELMEELREYLLYTQIKAQGEDSMAARSIPGTIPAAMLPDMMRAAGYYPSEADIAVMNTHLGFIAASRDLDSIENVGFEDVLCLYANHRPLVEATHEDIVQAFLALGANPNNGKLPRDQLITLLQQIGESMSMEELSSTLDSLTGMRKAVKALPHTVDAPSFASDILGFERD